MDFKILCIDGGGFKGLYAATLLHEIEKANKPLYKHFDLICGTSTGGIIALGLCAGLSAGELKDFYLKHGPKIFPHHFRFFRWLHGQKQIFLWSKYSNKYLQKSLREVFKEKRIRDSNSYLCVPTVNVKTGKNVVFKTDHDNGLTRDGRFFMADVAMATTAAPTFFPVAEVRGFTNGQFIDGGLWANNPSFIGMIEAYTYFLNKKDRPFKRFRMLSIPSVTHEKPIKLGMKKRLSVIDWRDKIFQQIVSSQTKSIGQSMVFLAKHLSENSEFVEIPSPILTGDDARNIDMDIANKKAREILVGYGEDVGHSWNKRPEITSFFDDEKIQPVFYSKAEVPNA